MSPRAADPALPGALIEAAARTLAEEGSAGLSLRRLATDVGTSTMAVYTHFGGMGELRRAVQRESFRRLVERLDEVDESDDALADLIRMGWAYFDYARAEPNLFRAVHLERRVDPDDVGLSDAAHLRLVAGVERCLAEGRIPPVDIGADAVATQLWAFVHGVATLLLAGSVTDDAAFLAFAFGGANLFRGMGVPPDDLERSIAAARDHVLDAEPTASGPLAEPGNPGDEPAGPGPAGHGPARDGLAGDEPA
jgi:AcrR family transcriptional regulator